MLNVSFIESPARSGCRAVIAAPAADFKSQFHRHRQRFIKSIITGMRAKDYINAGEAFNLSRVRNITREKRKYKGIFPEGRTAEYIRGQGSLFRSFVSVQYR